MARQKMISVLAMLLLSYSGACFAESPALTPSERIKENVQKVKDDPSLRGRWDPRYYTKSAAAAQNDNLALKILDNIREDAQLSKLVVRLKIRSFKGKVALDGFVNNEAERSLIARKVRGMNGVKEVQNHLKIKTSDKDLLE